jgi:hypothetical protein
LSLRVLEEAVSCPFELEVVRCQKICKGPVVGVEHPKGLLWFKRLDTKRAVSAFGRFVRDGRMSKPLKKHHSRKRDGKMR